MAINEAAPGVTVTVVVNEQALPEYTDANQEEKPKTVTRYIEAQSNHKYDIHIKVAKGTKFKGDCLAFDTYVDGVWLDEPLVNRDDTKTEDATVVIAGRYLPNGLAQTLQWDVIESATGGNLYGEAIERVKKLGSIKIRVTHDNFVARDLEATLSPVEEIGIVPEKIFKWRALTHCTSFAPPSVAQDLPKYWVTEEVDHPINRPAPKFLFKYRSKEGLKAGMITPRTPSPEPLEDREELSKEEVKELQKQMRALKGGPVNLKRERMEKPDPEPNKRPRHMPAAGDVQLTIDDSGVRQTSTDHLPPRQEKEIINISSDDESDCTLHS